MALTVSTAPQYGGTLAVGPSSTATIPNGALQGVPVQVQGSGTPVYSTPSGGTTYGATSVAAPTGPSAAQVAETNRLAGVRTNTASAQSGLIGGANQSIADNRLKFGNDSADFATGIQTGQAGINTGRANNQLNLRRTMSGIAAGIRQGVRSGGVTLANQNALDSGASEALARAYAQNGNQQAGDANNQSQLKENEFDLSQTNLNTQQATGLNRLKGWRDNETARVSGKLFNDLSALDTSASSQGVTGAVDIGARDRLIAQASAELDQIDAITHGTLATVHGYTPDEARAKAAEMDQLGVGASPFTVEAAQMTGAPAGPALGQFGIGPVYRKDQTTGVVQERGCYGL